MVRQWCLHTAWAELITIAVVLGCCGWKLFSVSLAFTIIDFCKAGVYSEVAAAWNHCLICLQQTSDALLAVVGIGLYMVHA